MSNLINEFYKRLGVNVSFDVIDDMIMSDNNILRPILGHAFEFEFENIIRQKLLGRTKSAGGDSDIDLIVIDSNNNNHTIQIKTLNKQTIKNNLKFGVNLHKTHGQEKRPNNLYPIKWPCPMCEHEGEEFPDFLVIPHPSKGILIIPKSYIPENKSYPGHYDDPAIFDWDSKWLNRWDLLGFHEYKGLNLRRGEITIQNNLPRTCKAVNLTFEELLIVWLKPENFRMIDMNLRGNLREPALTKLLSEMKRKVENPVGRYPKHDLVVDGKKVQIKGLSKKLTDINKKALSVEVMGTHGKGAIRRYSETDFDYLGIVIEPIYIHPELGLKNDTYHFAFIPSEDLPLHYRNKTDWDTSDKLYDVVKFDIVKEEQGVYLYPSNIYNKNKNEANSKKSNSLVSYRGKGKKYKIDDLPEEL